jgi:protein-L-isoaspartate O-methyltransferase
MLGNVRGQRILDAGCGHGYLSRMLAARGAQVTGVERLGCHLRETAEPALDPVAAAAADPAAGAYVHLPNFLVVAARRP